MKKIVLTGAPKSGKSTVINGLKAMFEEYMYVPEVPTLFIDNKLSEFDWQRITGTPQSDSLFIQDIIYAREALESVFERVGDLAGKKAIICDRGVPDAAVYIDEHHSSYEVMTLSKVEHDVLMYDAVIHLATYTGDSIYAVTKKTDPSLDVRLSLQDKISTVWRTNPNYFYIDEDVDMSEKINKVADIILQIT